MTCNQRVGATVCAVAGCFAVVACSSNVPSWQFVDGTSSAGLSRSATTYDLVAADYDRDGLQDLLVINHLSSPVLFKNIGGGKFQDVTPDSGLVSVPNDLDVVGHSPMESDEAGFRLWHSQDPFGGWLLSWKSPGAIVLTLDSRARFVDVHVAGVEPSAVSYKGQRLLVTGDSDRARRGLLSFKTDAFSTPFEMQLLSDNIDDGRSVIMGLGKAQVPLLGTVFGITDNHCACWFDVDRDGDLDLYLSRGADQRNALGMKSDSLYIQENGRFVDRTKEFGLGNAEGAGRGVAALDVNNDGWLDLVVVNLLTPNVLYVNEGGSHFREAGDEYGIRTVADGRLKEVASADYDKDGFADLVMAGKAIYLFHNERGKGFHLVGDLAAGRGDIGYVNSIRWADWDGDGDMDLYVAQQDKVPGYLWHKENEIRFYQRLSPGKRAELFVVLRGALVRRDLFIETQQCLDCVHGGDESEEWLRVAESPSDWHGAKYSVREEEGRLQVVLDNVQGDRDVAFSGILVFTKSVDVKAVGFDSSSVWRRLRHKGAEFVGGRDFMFENDGHGQFVDKARALGISGVSRDAAFADFDGDGDVDMFRLRNVDPGGSSSSQLLVNDGGGRFRVVSEMDMGLYPCVGDRVVALDAQGDGRMDVFATNGGSVAPGLGLGPYVLLENRLP